MDLFNLSAKLVLDKKEYDQGIDDAESKAYKTGEAIGTGMKGIGSAFGSAITGLAKLTVAGIAAAGTAVGALVKQSVQEYAEYQQTWGGVQKLYGTAGMSVEQYAESVGKSVDEVRGKYNELTQAQDMVLKNAQNAYATAGMSTQQYMEQATSFSAALINSLGGDTVKAAEQTDVAMRAIADNYNTFGGDMQNIQNAYQGFAKGNYMMLDNLKLGYGGTKTEMERLIADANTYAESMGMAGDLSIDSFSDIVTAIDLVQQKQGIAGTTAREATETISGSLNMVKAAWDNLVAGISDPEADLSTLIDNLVNSIVGYTDEAGNHVKGFIDNIIPTVKQAATGIVQVISEAIPKMAEQLPSLLNDTLPMIIEAAVEMLNALIEALPTVMQVLFDQLPTIIEAVVNAVLELLPMVIELGLQFVMALAQGIVEALPELLPALVDTVLQIVEFLTNPDNLTQLIEAGVQIILALVNGLIEALPRLIEALPVIVQNLVTALINNLPLLIDATIQIVMAIAQALIENLPLLLDALVQITFALINGIILAIPDFITAIIDLLTEVTATLMESLPTFVSNGISLIESLIEGIVSMIGTVVQAIIKLITNIIEAIKNRFERLKEAGKNMIGAIKDGITSKISEAKQWGQDLIQNFIDGILAKWEALKSTVASVAQSVKDFLGFSEPKLGPLSNFHTYAPDMMNLFMQGIRDNKSALIDTVADAFDFQNLVTAPELDTSIVGTPSGGASGDYDMRNNTTNQTWNVNIYQPMESAVDVARKLREESQYGLLGGGSLA